MLLRLFILALAIFLLAMLPGRSAVIAQWLFSDANTAHLPSFWAFGTSQTILPEVGSGTMTATTGSGGTPSSGASSTMQVLDDNSTLIAPDDGSKAIAAGSQTSRAGNTFIMEVDTTNHEEITVTVDVTGANNRSWRGAYSIDNGSNWVDVGPFIPQGGSWVRESYDLSAVDEVEGLSNLLFRIANLTATSNSHAARFDNFTVSSAVTVPEPSATLMMLTGLAGLLGQRRRR